jgi:hypothetical protein
MKAFSLVVTLILLLIGCYFLVVYFQTCYQCNPTTVKDEFERPEMVFAIGNFAFAILSAYLITKRKFNASAIIAGVIVGLQAVVIGTITLSNI